MKAPGSLSALPGAPAIRIRNAGLQCARQALLVLCLSLLSSCQSGPPQPAATRPNLVLIVVDALRASNVSFLGYERDTTPNLDALASESYVFDQAISVGGNTPTAMSALMTGHYAFFPFGEKWRKKGVSFGMARFYVDSSEVGLPRSLETLAEQLKGAGYTTAGVVTNTYLKTEFNFHRGFDHYYEFLRAKGTPYGKGETVTQAGVDFLHSTTARPFFLYLHYMDTHGPYSPPDFYRQKFQVDDRPFDKTAKNWRYRLWQRWRLFDPQDTDADALTDYMRDLYDGEVAYADNCIGEVIRTLQDLELMGDTVIALTADHGEEFLEHGGTTHKRTLYDELVRVPLLIRLPGRDGGRISDLVRNFDLMATLLELAGVDTSGHGLDAVDLRPLIDGKVPSLRLAAYAGFPRIRMLRTSRIKLLHFRRKESELYDLVRDPGEQQNLYPNYAANPGTKTAYFERVASMEEILSQMVKYFLAEQLAAAPAEPAPLDPKTEEQLRALGYLD